MKKIVTCFIIIFLLNIIHLPVFAKENTLTIEQMKEINTFGNKIEYLLSQKKNSQACLLAYEMIQRYPNEPDAYFSYAKASYHAGYSDRAIEYYKKCFKLDKTYHQAILNIGLVYYQQKEYTKAIKYYTKAIRITAKNNKYKKEDNALAYSNRALAKYYNRQLRSALKDYNKSLSIKNEYIGVDHIYYNRGLCKYDLGDKSGADDDYSTAKKINPKFKYIYYNKRI